MKDYLSLGTTPVEENCVQLTDEKYMLKANEECRKFISLLEKTFPKTRGMYSIKRCPHDFGTYLDVIINYDDENEKETELALEVEGNIPSTWY